MACWPYPAKRYPCAQRHWFHQGCVWLASVRHGASLPVCLVLALLVLAPSWAEEPPQVCRKRSTEQITSRQGCAGAGCAQIPLPHGSGCHRGCKPSRGLQHSTVGTWPGGAALAVGDSCSEDTKTQLSLSRGCAHLALPPSHCFFPLSTLRKPCRGTPASPTITAGSAMRTCPQHLPSSRLLCHGREQPRV